MSDENNDFEDVTPKRMPGASDPDGYTDDDVSSKDYFLDVVMSAVVGFKDQHNGDITATIQCGGVIVSGKVISATAWVSVLAQQVRDGGSPDLGDSVEQAFLQMLQDSADEWDRRDAADLEGRARRFIHMRDVKLISGERTVNVPLWRGHLNDVSGWSLGA